MNTNLLQIGRRGLAAVCSSCDAVDMRLLLLCIVCLAFGCSKSDRVESTVNGTAVRILDLTSERNSCGVHQLQMEARQTEIEYGLIRYPPELNAVRKANPHIEVALGGCVISENSPTHVKKWVCSTCDSNWNAALLAASSSRSAE
jgi:hypothetical protein